MIKLKDLLQEKGIEKGAFHGYKMTPQQMRIDACSTEWTTPDQDTGCPQFSDSMKISKEDIQKAIKYLNEEELQTLIAYSRGGAILLEAIKMGARRPNTIYMVAAAWKRQWPTVSLTGAEAKGTGFIIHGGLDTLVPLKHSVLLAKQSGMPLYVFPDANHFNILKYKESPTSGKRLKNLDSALKELPDWGESGAAPEEQLQQQKSFADKI